jgi:hypothetical protein
VTGGRPPGGDPDGLVTVGRFIDPIAAEFARSRLESDGLTGYVQGGGLGSLLPTAVVFPILLQVRAADADRAAEILADVPPTALLSEEREADREERPGQGAGS